MEALRFRSPDRKLLMQIREEDWEKTLDFCDRTQLTLPLGLVRGSDLPESVRARICHNLTNNGERWLRFKKAYQDLARVYEAAGVESVVLKGFSHCPRFVNDPRHRPQVDLDLLLQQKQMFSAYELARGLGYEPIDEHDSHPINHLPTLIRKTGWQWSGDHFDVDIPVSIELHFQLWDRDTERFGAEGLDDFWERRQTVQIEHLRFSALHDADAVANASLHLLRHLLRGKLRPYHVYEISWMLDRSATDDVFWRRWSELHPESLRRLEAICFSLAQHWFDCALPDAAAEDIAKLPDEVTRWLTNLWDAPLAARFRPNKDELWLHWNLLESSADRIAVLRRRLLPGRLPTPVGALHVPKDRLTGRRRWKARWKNISFLGSRAQFHLRTLPAVAWSAMRWFGAGTGLGSQYWRFFLAEGFFDFGMFVFFFLYNLYLLQLGYRENFLGILSSVMTAGSVAGSVVAAAAMQRFGIRKTLVVSFSLTAALSALRAFVTFPPGLIGLAGVAGIAQSAWPVAFSPGITQLTTEKNRPMGFSIFCSAGIAIGIFGGLAAGRLPGWLLHSHVASSSIESYRLALSAGCVIVLLALWPLSRVNFGTAAPPKRKRHRPSPLVLRFLIAIAAWNLGTGALNPFFNVFFARWIHLPLQQIGYVFASAQVAQICAILCAPLFFRRFGLTRSISGMQSATALVLLALAAAGSPIIAAIGYCCYMMAQYMSEPGMFTLLMEGVIPEERGGASALNFLVTSGGIAVASATSGWLLARFGYPPVVVGAAIMCLLAALLFRVLLANPKLPARSDP